MIFRRYRRYEENTTGNSEKFVSTLTVANVEKKISEESGDGRKAGLGVLFV